MRRQITRLALIAFVASSWSLPVFADDDQQQPDRRRPGQPTEEPAALPPIDSTAVPPPARAEPRQSIPILDRWRLVEAVGVRERWWDPYNQNTLKGDRPLFDDWFIALSAISDTVYEFRALPTPVGAQSTERPGSIDLFGREDQQIFNQNLIASFSLIKGDTAFRPQDIEVRFTPVFNYNHVKVKEDRILRIDPTRDTRRGDGHIGVQELFLDYHLRNVSDRYDFDSVRVGIQPLTLDFRGFLFQDQQPGIRFFGNRNNNRLQYNVGWVRRLEKDTNSGLNDLGKRLRDDDVFFANVYLQDVVTLGYTIQGIAAYNRNREGNDPYFYDKNGFLQRPASIGFERPSDYDVLYLGVNGDGHFGRLNITHSFYAAFGDVEANPFTSAFENEKAKIRSFFAAVEPSMDFDWIRVRLQGLYASGDGDPFDNKARGFDAIFENPQFAGADTSYWIRQPVPLIGGGGVGMSLRNGLLINLRSSREHGQSNFINPGTVLLGAGADFDVLPELRVSVNLSHIAMAKKGVVEVLRNQELHSKSVGWDTSLSLLYRPNFIQNVVFRASGAMLTGGGAYKELFAVSGDTGKRHYTALFNLILTY
ncbi:MAG: hypothetical protein KDE14_01380 [Rhodobacteraceae bacterium]|nr:hypothetical protein [Paracoccaceae bacterium]